MDENNIIEKEKNEFNNKETNNINEEEEEKENLIEKKEKVEKINNNVNEEEKDNLIYQKENTENLNDININFKEKIQAPFLNNNEDNTKIIKEEIIRTNNNYENENKIITDYIITIQYTKILKIPYFIFADIIHFYFPYYKFKSIEMKLSEISTPPFALITKECK